jgi:hypothetical protein
MRLWKALLGGGLTLALTGALVLDYTEAVATGIVLLMSGGMVASMTLPAFSEGRHERL